MLRFLIPPCEATRDDAQVMSRPCYTNDAGKEANHIQRFEDDEETLVREKLGE
jgi:hypothetical protein